MSQNDDMFKVGQMWVVTGICVNTGKSELPTIADCPWWVYIKADCGTRIFLYKSDNEQDCRELAERLKELDSHSAVMLGSLTRVVRRFEVEKEGPD